VVTVAHVSHLAPREPNFPRSHRPPRPGTAFLASGRPGRRPEGGVAAPEALDVLTAREREVLAQAAEGLSNDEIAARMHVSPLTVRTHAGRAMTKLSARHRAQLVAMAYESALVRVDPPQGRGTAG